MTYTHTAADVADFEAYIAQATAGRTGDERVKLERYLRANPGSTVRDWSHGYPRHLCENVVDLDAPASGRARLAYVRDMATRALAHTLPLDIRREAARDVALVWNPLARRYRHRAAGDAARPCASADQTQLTTDLANATPAPRAATGGNTEGARESKSP